MALCGTSSQAHVSILPSYQVQQCVCFSRFFFIWTADLWNKKRHRGAELAAASPVSPSPQNLDLVKCLRPLHLGNRCRLLALQESSLRATSWPSHEARRRGLKQWQLVSDPSLPLMPAAGICLLQEANHPPPPCVS